MSYGGRRQRRAWLAGVTAVAVLAVVALALGVGVVALRPRGPVPSLTSAGWRARLPGDRA